MMTPEQAVFVSILICIAGAVLTLLTAAQPDAGGLARLLGDRRDGGADLLRGGDGAGRRRFRRLRSVLQRCRPSVSPCACMWTD